MSKNKQMTESFQSIVDKWPKCFSDKKEIRTRSEIW